MIGLLKNGLILSISLLLFACKGGMHSYDTFAGYPGFKEYYAGRCKGEQPTSPVSDHDKELLFNYSPRLILPPGSRYPIDFYRDYLPYTVLRWYRDKSLLKTEVTPEDLKAYQDDTSVYIDLDKKRFIASGLDKRVGNGPSSPFNHKRPVVYARSYREKVELSDEQGQPKAYNLIFLKYNVVFAISGLPAELPMGLETLLRSMGLDPDDWHELELCCYSYSPR